MAEVIEINNIKDLAPYRMAWNELLPKTPGASFFHTFDWLELYWKHFGEDQKLRVLIVMSLGKPIGILPLCIRKEKFKVGTLRVLTYPLDHWGTWFGPIGPNVAATMMMAMRHIQETKKDWDLFEPRWIDNERSDRARTSRAMRAVGMHPKRAAYQESSSVELSGTWDEYWASRSSKWRNNIRRSKKGLNVKGEVKFVRYRPESAANGDGDPNWELYNSCCDISSKSWQSDSEIGTTLTSPNVAVFLREAHEVAARLGMVEILVMFVGGKPAAFAYNYHFNGHIHGLRSGYDPEFAKNGIGAVLLNEAIKDSFEIGDVSYDLGAGWFDYKHRVHTSSRTSYRFTHYRGTSLKSQGVRLTRWLKGNSLESLPNKKDQLSAS